MRVNSLQRKDRNITNVAKETQKKIIPSLFFSAPCYVANSIRYFKNLQITATLNSLFIYETHYYCQQYKTSLILHTKGLLSDFKRN
jgi:hypothetical protein